MLTDAGPEPSRRDSLGRLVGTNTLYSFLSGTQLTSTYACDASSNRVSFTNPQSQVTNYTYDSLNRLTGLADPNTGSFGFGYDALSRRTSLTRPNGVATSYSYDSLSHLLSILHSGGSLPGSTSYTYDAAGNTLTKTAVQAGNPNPVSVLSQYSYDNIYELTQAVVNGSVTEGYTYDAVGNRLTSAGPTSYNYNASNELTSSSVATYTYDNNGNTLSKTTSAGTTSYTWDFENRLTSVTLPGTGGTVNFQYDPFGRRIYKSTPSGTSVYVYDGDNVIQELSSSGNPLASYTHGPEVDEPLAEYQRSTTSYLHTDGLGSITSLTNPAGGVAASYVYDSFGNLTASTGAVTNPFQYTAREFDLETGLYYYRARYYDSMFGRFVSEDPIRLVADINSYRYVKGNPLVFIDPSGLEWEYCQNSGDLYYRDPVTHEEDYVGTGYAGIGAGLNNPSMQNLLNMGPLPRGWYLAGPQQTIVTIDGRRLAGAMRLLPLPGTDLTGRTGGFVIHGDNQAHNHTGSTGCPVLARGIRDRIANSEDKAFHVVDCSGDPWDSLSIGR